MTFASLIEAYATIFAGGPVAQSRGDLRVHGLVCILLAGLLGLAYTVVARPSLKPGTGLVWLVFLIPAYALLQVVPLPLNVMRILSPARAGLTDALRPLMPLPRRVPISVTPSATLYHFLLFAACSVIFLVIFDLSKSFSRRPWAVTIPLIVVAVAQAIIGLLQVAGNPDGIATGTYLIRNHYAGFLEMILPFPAVLPFAVLGARGRGRIKRGKLNEIAYALLACLGFGIAVVLFTAIVLSLSRMGFISSLTSIVFIAIAALVRGSSPRRISLVAGVVLVAAILFFLLPTARLVTRFGEIEESGEQRSSVWDETVSLIKTYPVFGCGLGAYESAFLKFKVSSPALVQDYAHNDYLQYFAELGAAGFTLAFIPLGLVLARLRAGIRHIRPDIRWLSLACAGSAAAIALHSFVDFNLYVPANLFTFAWILGVAAYLGEWSSRNEGADCESTVIVLGPQKPA